jgi:hypothetical protein
MEFKQPIHGYCDPEVYGVVVPVQLSLGEITVYVDFDRKTGKVKETETNREVSPGNLQPFHARAIVLRRAEIIARQFAGDALPLVN